MSRTYTKAKKIVPAMNKNSTDFATLLFFFFSDSMRKLFTYLISPLSLLFYLFFLGNCDHNFRNYGKAKMKYATESEKLDEMEVWTPYGYYDIEFSCFFYSHFPPNLGSKGWSKGNHFTGSYHWRNNHFSSNDLPLEEVNKRLERIELNEPVLFWIKDKKDSEGNRTVGLHFFILSKSLEGYKNDQELLELAQKHAPFPLPIYKKDY